MVILTEEREKPIIVFDSVSFLHAFPFARSYSFIQLRDKKTSQSFSTMAEALSDDIDATLTISTPGQANYPGPKPGTHYPLNLHYCGGQ